MPRQDSTIGANQVAPIGIRIDDLLPPGTIGQVIKHDGTDWSAGTVSGTGDVVGPGVAVNNNLAVFDGTTGKLIKDGGAPGGGGKTGEFHVYFFASPGEVAIF